MAREGAASACAARAWTSMESLAGQGSCGGAPRCQAPRLCRAAEAACTRLVDPTAEKAVLDQVFEALRRASSAAMPAGDAGTKGFSPGAIPSSPVQCEMRAMAAESKGRSRSCSMRREASSRSGPWVIGVRRAAPVAAMKAAACSGEKTRLRRRKPSGSGRASAPAKPALFRRDSRMAASAVVGWAPASVTTATATAPAGSPSRTTEVNAGRSAGR